MSYQGYENDASAGNEKRLQSEQSIKQRQAKQNSGHPISEEELGVTDYMPPKVSEQYDGIKNKNPDPQGWTNVNKTIYEGLMEEDFYPALYYTDHDPAVGENGHGYTECDETVLHKFHDKETRPLG
ncbi:MAG: hypothetical protein Q4G07_04535 [Oscillospiraceae bacterium]|nr:hypothetical protein [Oscillospiraceae bacterium]